MWVIFIGDSEGAICDTAGMERETETNGVTDRDWLPIPPDLGDGRMSGPIPVRRADLWALVLHAREIPCRQERAGLGRTLLVPSDRLEDALDELRLFEEENRDWPPATPVPVPLVENTLATLSILLLVATFHNITQLRHPIPGFGPIDWVGIGGAAAGAIRDGQWWRTVTALTLHSGPVHLLGNLLIGGFFIVVLCRQLGSGLAWCLLVLSGILGNLANALFQPAYHNSIGASTLVFGAVGILGAIHLAQPGRRWRRRWLLPVAAALALLAMLGTEGDNTDLGAHLFGFACGAPLGLVAGYLTDRLGYPGRRGNVLLACAAALVPVVAWWAALVNG